MLTGDGPSGAIPTPNRLGRTGLLSIPSAPQSISPAGEAAHSAPTRRRNRSGDQPFDPAGRCVRPREVRRGQRLTAGCHHPAPGCVNGRSAVRELAPRRQRSPGHADCDSERGSDSDCGTATAGRRTNGPPFAGHRPDPGFAGASRSTDTPVWRMAARPHPASIPRALDALPGSGSIVRVQAVGGTERIRRSVQASQYISPAGVRRQRPYLTEAAFSAARPGQLRLRASALANTRAVEPAGFAEPRHGAVRRSATECSLADSRFGADRLAADGAMANVGNELVTRSRNRGSLFAGARRLPTDPVRRQAGLAGPTPLLRGLDALPGPGPQEPARPTIVGRTPGMPRVPGAQQISRGMPRVAGAQQISPAATHRTPRPPVGLGRPGSPTSTGAHRDAPRSAGTPDVRFGVSHRSSSDPPRSSSISPRSSRGVVARSSPSHDGGTPVIRRLASGAADQGGDPARRSSGAMPSFTDLSILRPGQLAAAITTPPVLLSAGGVSAQPGDDTPGRATSGIAEPAHSGHRADDGRRIGQLIRLDGLAGNASRGASRAVRAPVGDPQGRGAGGARPRPARRGRLRRATFRRRSIGAGERCSAGHHTAQPPQRERLQNRPPQDGPPPRGPPSGGPSTQPPLGCLPGLTTIFQLPGLDRVADLAAPTHARPGPTVDRIVGPHRGHDRSSPSAPRLTPSRCDRCWTQTETITTRPTAAGTAGRGPTRAWPTPRANHDRANRDRASPNGPSGTGPSGTGPTGTGPSGTGPSGAGPIRRRVMGTSARTGPGELPSPTFRPAPYQPTLRQVISRQPVTVDPATAALIRRAPAAPPIGIPQHGRAPRPGTVPAVARSRAPAGPETPATAAQFVTTTNPGNRNEPARSGAGRTFRTGARGPFQHIRQAADCRRPSRHPPARPAGRHDPPPAQLRRFHDFSSAVSARSAMSRDRRSRHQRHRRWPTR